MPPAAVEGLFGAADALNAVDPRSVVGDQRALRLDIPELGVEGACVSIIGALGENLGALIVPPLAGHEASRKAATRPRRKSSRIDLGTSWLSLSRVPQVELPEGCRREIIEHGWTASDTNRFPPSSDILALFRATLASRWGQLRPLANDGSDEVLVKPMSESTSTSRPIR